MKSGDVIGLFCENRLEFPMVLLASFCLGATVAPLNVTYTARELHHALNLSRPKYLFVTQLTKARALQILPLTDFVEYTVCLDGVGSNDKIDTYQQLMNETPVSSFSYCLQDST